MALLVGMPLVERPALLDDLPVRDQRKERCDHMRVGSGKIVHHARIGHVEPQLVGDLAAGRGDVERELGGAISLGLIGKREQLVAVQIELGVRGQADGAHRAIEIPLAPRGERVRIELHRQ